MYVNRDDGIVLSIQGDILPVSEWGQGVSRGGPGFVDGLEMVAEVRAKPARERCS